MKLISINIENNLHNKLVFEFLKKEKPDVICLQELLEEDFGLYKKQLGFEGIRQVWSYWKDQGYYLQFKGKKQGVAIFARNIVESGSVFYVGNEGNISKSFDEYMSNEDFQQNRALLWANIKNDNGETYKFMTTQLPVTKEGEVTPFQLEVIDLLLEQLAGMGEFVFCGDTNAPRGREAFNRLAKKYKDNIPPEYKTSIDQNLHKVKGIQFMVDALFTTPGYKASDVKLVDGVSDHMAVVAEIIKS